MLLSLYININIFISLQQWEGQSVMNQEGFQEGNEDETTQLVTVPVSWRITLSLQNTVNLSPESFCSPRQEGEQSSSNNSWPNYCHLSDGDSDWGVWGCAHPSLLPEVGSRCSLGQRLQPWEGVCPDTPRAVNVPQDSERTFLFNGNVIIFFLHVIVFLSVRG